MRTVRWLRVLIRDNITVRKGTNAGYDFPWGFNYFVKSDLGIWDEFEYGSQVFDTHFYIGKQGQSYTVHLEVPLLRQVGKFITLGERPKYVIF